MNMLLYEGIFFFAGMTLGKVILKVNKTEFQSGLTYTGASRVTKESDLTLIGFDVQPGNYPDGRVHYQFPSLQK